MKNDQLEKLRALFEADSQTFDFKYESLLTEVTEAIVKRMIEIGISRTELAKRLDTSKAAVTKMLDGNANFTLKRLLGISLALDCEMPTLSFTPKGFERREFFVSREWVSKRDDYAEFNIFSNLNNEGQKVA